VALLDQDTSVVDRLGKTQLVDTGLQTALQEILNLQGQDVIELHAGLVEHTDTDQTANQGIAFEQTLGVLLVEGEQLTAISQYRIQSHQFFLSQEVSKDRRHTEQHDESWTG
jgi:hypothetical protein